MYNLKRYLAGTEELMEILTPSPKPCTVIMGSYNSGKSTLINNLLGQDVSPVDATPATSCLIYFDYGSSFSARYIAPGDKKTFDKMDQLHAFLNRVEFPAGRVEIQLPSPLLKKCRLVDTPGIDFLGGEAARLAGQVLAGADKIIYLFHQRGIEDFSRLFLYKLASMWKGKELRHITFWLNCNLGTCDGSSLESTGAALREIFLNKMRLNTLNSIDRENVDVLRLFLEVDLARDNFRNSMNVLRKTDNELTVRISKLGAIKDDNVFLAEYWTLMDTVRKLLKSEVMLNSLPSVMQEMEELLKTMNSSNLGAVIRKPEGKQYSRKAMSLQETRHALLHLINSLSTDKSIAAYLDRSSLLKLKRLIEGKRFTVVVAGGFSTGKSTFINALLKDTIMPTADGPTTASVNIISYGSTKTATVHLPLQVTLKVYEQIWDKASLNREVLAAVEKWMSDPRHELALLQASTGGNFRHVDRQEMSRLIRQTRELFAAGSISRNSGNKTGPAAFKPVPLKSLRGSGVLHEIRVTFKNAGTRKFDLNRAEELKEFRDFTSQENVFKIDSVEIRHPCNFLELADFIDTPGLDWVQKYHYDKTSNYIRNCDSYLIFLNARHILNDMDKDSIFEILKNHMPHDSSDEPGKYFLVINFCDVLTPLQRESVYNFVKKHLHLFTGPESATRSLPYIHMISALKGLSGEDGGIKRFLSNLEEAILRQSGRGYYQDRVRELQSVLEQAYQKIEDELQSNNLTSERKKVLLRAKEDLREFRRKLKEIRMLIYSPGRL